MIEYLLCNVGEKLDGVSRDRTPRRTMDKIVVEGKEYQRVDAKGCCDGCAFDTGFGCSHLENNDIICYTEDTLNAYIYVEIA